MNAQPSRVMLPTRKRRQLTFSFAPSPRLQALGVVLKISDVLSLRVVYLGQPDEHCLIFTATRIPVVRLRVEMTQATQAHAIRVFSGVVARLEPAWGHEADIAGVIEWVLDSRTVTQTITSYRSALEGVNSARNLHLRETSWTATRRSSSREAPD
jgi:hypothetical protein